MHERKALSGFPLAGAAAVGVMLGHWLGYLIAVPQAGLRESILVSTGHSYWTFAVRCSLIAAVAGLAVLALRHFSHDVETGETLGRLVRWTALRLALIQVIVFCGMETAERVLSRIPVAEMLHHHIFALGLAVQLVVAFLGALMLVLLSRSAARVCTALRCLVPRLSQSPTARALQHTPAPRGVLSGAWGLRGPPAPNVQRS